MGCGYLQARPYCWELYPSGGHSPTLGFGAYRWKLTNFTTGEKNRAQNCFTVSSIKLDDVFSDVFGKSASAITTWLLENLAEKIMDVSGFRTKGMKATDEQVLAAVDGEMCAKQAEKLRIICSHMDSLELCKANLKSLILSTAVKYLPQLTCYDGAGYPILCRY